VKETIFISSLTILFIFYSFYYIANPGFAFPMAIGTIAGFIIEILAIVLLAGIRVFDTGLSDVSIKAIAVIGTVVNILFGIRIDASSGNIVMNMISAPLALLSLFLPHSENGQIMVGMGLLYPIGYNIFVVEGMGLLGHIGFIIISGLSVLALVSGILIAFGGASTN